MNPPVVLSEDDLTCLVEVASQNPCRDPRQQAALQAVAALLPTLFVDWIAYVEDSWEWQPCPACDRPVPRQALDALCPECREDVTAEARAREARRP